MSKTWMSGNQYLGLRGMMWLANMSKTWMSGNQYLGLRGMMWLANMSKTWMSGNQYLGLRGMVWLANMSKTWMSMVWLANIITCEKGCAKQSASGLIKIEYHAVLLLLL
jgi:hypothetical protein